MRIAIILFKGHVIIRLSILPLMNICVDYTLGLLRIKLCESVYKSLRRRPSGEVEDLHLILKETVNPFSPSTGGISLHFCLQ